MHIGIDIGIQRLNSNVFGKLLPEQKDYFINTVTQEFVKLALTDEKNTVYDIVTYADIREYYERLQTYIRSIQLNIVEELGYGYVYGQLPQSITIGTITTGVLYHGVSYKIIDKGTIDLSTFGFLGTPVDGDIFECSITEQTGVSITITKGEKYRIVNAHDGVTTGLFVPVGAPDNIPGTEFTATSSATVTGGVSTVIQNLSKEPTWNSATLIPVSDVGYYMNIKTRSSIAKGNIISSGEITKGKKYIVKVIGTTADLVDFGGVITPDVGYVFVCSVTGTPTWAGGTHLYEIDDNGNRLVKMQDVDDFLENGFGSTKSSPISVFANNRLRVYHDNKFKIERIFLDYIRKPITVDINASIDSDLPESTQPFLVDLVVKKVAALTSNPAYPAMVNEVRDVEND